MNYELNQCFVNRYIPDHCQSFAASRQKVQQGWDWKTGGKKVLRGCITQDIWVTSVCTWLGLQGERLNDVSQRFVLCLGPVIKTRLSPLFSHLNLDEKMLREDHLYLAGYAETRSGVSLQCLFLHVKACYCLGGHAAAAEGTVISDKEL